MNKSRFIFITVIFLLLMPLGWHSVRSFGARHIPRHVRVLASQGRYQLMVNDQPFYVQGAGVGEAFGRYGHNYLEMARTLGANAVRTWGTDQGNKRYLDEALRLGLAVDAGIWLNYADEGQTVSYITGQDYMQKKEREVLQYVRQYKNHPSILMWNIGNEAIAFTKSELERVALAKFLEQLIQKVHAEDPNHPVVYAAMSAVDLPYLKRYVPSLDIIGLNLYGSVIMAQAAWSELNFNKPCLFTEFGPPLPDNWKKDANGRAVELSDYAKAASYKNHWSLIRERKGLNLGGFIFSLGETSQNSMTFWNINYFGHKKEPYLVMQKLFLPQTKMNHAPRIESFTGVPQTAEKGSLFRVRLSAKDPEGLTLRYTYRASTAIENVYEYAVNHFVPISAGQKGNEALIKAPDSPGVYRVYGMVQDELGNITTTNQSVQVTG